MVSFIPVQPQHHRRHRTSCQLTPVRVARPSLLALPHELILKIAQHIVAAPGILPGTSFISAKPSWFGTIAGLANASRDTRDASLRAWFRVFIVREEGDWHAAITLSAVRFSVREIYVCSQAVSPATCPDALLSFPALRSAHINAHNDVSFDPRHGYTYFTLLPLVPRSLKRLAIAHAHAPDAERLQALVNRDGLRLEELRLGRCTLFDCANEGCSYWPAFPHDHDAYFSDDGSVEYAMSIAQDLMPLRSLRTLHLGVYLTPHIALATHQRDHAPFFVNPANSHVVPVNPPLPPLLGNPPPPPHHLHLLAHPHHRAPLHCPSLWASPCSACYEQFGPATKVAEHTACRVLGSALPWIEEVSWAGYFERYGKGVSTWTRSREDWVRT
ncbi:hypothetical protein RhiJN_26478 [Ceratobasidium sp. AG-Ba]|nr:hypothetical protein RhiJN_26478 [Ceratobasidium sp. AG-Ba]